MSELFRGIIGTLIDSNDDKSLRINENHYLIYNINTGKIVEKDKAIQSLLLQAQNKYGIEDFTVLDTSKEFLLPGFIDCHIHAPQFPNNGLGYDLPLLQWLQEYTFPLESKYSDLDFASRVYNHVVETTLNYGTTTACYFATIHRPATLKLCDIAEERGQRVLVGKVNMNRNCPNTYRESTKDSLNETKLFVNEILHKQNDLITPVITPRFVPSCDPELLMGLGDLAAKKKLRIQSHMSESLEEIKWVKTLEPNVKTYSEVYQKYGLLNSNTLLAHCIHLNHSEMNLLKTVKTGIVHCPNSNNSILSGRMKLRKYLEFGFTKIGLGTDCSGGYSPSMLNAMRFTMATSKEEKSFINFEEAIYLATRGSASTLNLEDKIGRLEPGYYFDALIIRLNTSNSCATLFGHESIHDMVEKFVYLGDDRNIFQIFVRGRKI